MICAFTGHRPQRLPWGSREEDPRCQALKTILNAAVQQAWEQGCRQFLCGMARGCDLYFAEAVLACKRNLPEITLTALLPCPDQTMRWPLADRQRYEKILRECDAVEVLEPAYSAGCMLRRNKAMIDRAQCLISVFDGGPGGTAHTVRYARQRGLPIHSIWL